MCCIAAVQVLTKKHAKPPLHAGITACDYVEIKVRSQGWFHRGNLGTPPPPPPRPPPPGGEVATVPQNPQQRDDSSTCDH